MHERKSEKTHTQKKPKWGNLYHLEYNKIR
jgi:hypothetical protein